MQHYPVCENASKNLYQCILCNFVSLKLDKIKLHAKKIHGPKDDNIKKELVSDDESNGSDQSDEFWDAMDLSEQLTIIDEKHRIRKYAAQRGTTKHCYRYYFLVPTQEVKYPNQTFSAAHWFTLEYRNKFYKQLVFPEYEPFVTTVEDFASYFPKTMESIHVSTILMGASICDVRKYDHQWRQFKLWQSECADGTATFFCGGPIVCINWVPMPDSLDKPQYLAVVAKSEMDVFYKTGYSYKHPGLIQIWNCGVLNNRFAPSAVPFPAVHIAHNYGIIWDMEWCPSGAYQETTRLGLLAIACSDGNVYILSIPFPIKSSPSKPPPVYKIKPSLILKLHDSLKLLGNCEMQVTKLKWCKYSNGHALIAAGYSNGMVGLWNLTKKSKLLLQQQPGGDVVLFPYMSFLAHRGPVKVIDFGSESSRWLFTSSSDERSKFWDLTDCRYPIFKMKRGMASDGFWFTNWNSALICCDDGILHANTVASLISPRDFGSRPVPLFRTNSAVNCLALNEWMNCVSQGSFAGEFQIMFLDQIFTGLENEKNLRHKRLLLSCTKWIDRTKTPEELIKADENRKELEEKDIQEFSKLCEDTENVEILPSTYSDAAASFGVCFGDFNLQTRQTLPKEAFTYVTDNMLTVFPYDMYPLVSITCMKFNPNVNSFQSIALGYQIGFVRIQTIRFMKTKSKNIYDED